MLERIAGQLRRTHRRGLAAVRCGGLLDAGESDDSIRAYLQARYGDFVLYDPPLRPSTWLLWFSPLLLALVAGVVLARVVRRPAPAPTATEREQAHQLMQKIQ